MTGTSDTVTYRQAVSAIYMSPVTWVAIVGAFLLWQLQGFILALAFVVLVGGYSAHRTVNNLIESENST